MKRLFIPFPERALFTFHKKKFQKNISKEHDTWKDLDLILFAGIVHCLRVLRLPGSCEEPRFPGTHRASSGGVCPSTQGAHPAIARFCFRGHYRFTAASLIPERSCKDPLLLDVF